MLPALPQEPSGLGRSQKALAVFRRMEHVDPDALAGRGQEGAAMGGPPARGGLPRAPVGKAMAWKPVVLHVHGAEPLGQLDALGRDLPGAKERGSAGGAGAGT